MNENTKKSVMLGMLSAIAFVVVMIQIPFVQIPGLTLEYEAMDVIVAIGGFIYGPLSALWIAIVVAFVQMLTISSTGIIGFVMNVLSTCSFACLASFVYKKRHNRTGAFIGLLAGVTVMTGIMVLWNYFITPIYTGVPRTIVAGMLLPVFLPFNLVKGGLNMAITLLIYKPVVTALRKGNLVEASSNVKKDAKRENYWMLTILILFVLVSSVTGAYILSH